jgi:biopolymer transport protein ExbD
MRIGSPVPHKKARIEIIPLIDIMFFLLASFMLASLTMIRMQAIKMKLPTATAATKTDTIKMINVAVDAQGEIMVENKKISLVQFRDYLTKKHTQDTNSPVYISGDKDCRHGDIIRVLDEVHQIGIESVSFSITPPASK